MGEDSPKSDSNPLAFFWEVLGQYENEKAIEKKVFGFQTFPAIRHTLFSLSLTLMGVVDSSQSSQPRVNQGKTKKNSAVDARNSRILVVSAKEPANDPHFSNITYCQTLDSALKLTLHDLRTEVLGWRRGGLGKLWAFFVKVLYFSFFLPTQFRKYFRFFLKISSRKQKPFSKHELLLSCIISAAKLLASIPPQIYEFRAFRRWLSKSNVEKIVIRDAYTNASLVAAAKTLGITTFEVQHGIIHRYHPGYAYTQEGFQIQSFPDYLLTWGTAWTKSLKLPKGAIVVSLGYPGAREFSALQDYGPREIDMMFLSQDGHGFALLDKARAYAIENPQADVVFRLHPKEDRKDFNVKLPSNLRLNDPEDCEISEIASRCVCVAGISSTTLLESARLKCNVKIVPLPGSEVMEEFLKSGLFSFFGDENEGHLDPSKEKLLGNHFQELSGEDLCARIEHLFTDDVNSKQ